MRVWRGCAGGPNSAAGRHCRGACAVAGPSGFRRLVGASLDAANFALRILRLCAIVVGYDFGRVRDRNHFYVYEPFLLVIAVYCFATLAFIWYCADLICDYGCGRRLQPASSSAVESYRKRLNWNRPK